MLMRSFAVLLIVWLSACATIEDAGKAYFSKGRNVKGVEPVDALLERMNKEQELRTIMYGPSKTAKILQCTLLRNQLYVAASKGSAPNEVMDAVKKMEMAYQENDDAFLTVCDEIFATNIGKIFLRIQQAYVAKTR